MVSFHARAWEDYLYGLAQDKAMVRRINSLIRDVQRSPFSGIGKPEPLKDVGGGCWSRRIDAEHRLVYKVEGGALIVLQCRFHY